MSKQPSTVQTTQNSSTQVAPFVQDAQQALLSSGGNILGGFMGSAPNYAVAGLNADQTMGYDLTRSMAQDAFTGGGGNAGAALALGRAFNGQQYLAQNPDVAASATYGSNPLQHYVDYGAAEGRTAPAPASTTTSTPLLDFRQNQGIWQAPSTAVAATTTPAAAQGYTAQGYNPATYQAQGYDAAKATTSTFDPALATAAQVDGQQIRALLNPYQQDVVDTTNATLRRNYNATAANMGAKAAAAGAFGGSRQAIQSAQLDRSFGEQVATNTAKLMADGYDKATATAMANAQMRQQVELANQGAKNTAGQFNAAANNSTSQFNAGAQNTASQFTAGAMNTAGQVNSAAQNAAGQFLAGAQNTAGQFGASANNTVSLANAQAANTAALTNANAQNTRDQNNASTGASLFQNYNSNALQQQQLDQAKTQLDNNYALALANLQEAIRTNDQTRKTQATQALIAIGNAQQQLLQNAINVPSAALQQFGSIVPGQYASTTNATGTAPNTAPGIGQQLLGGALTLGGSFLGGPGGAAAGKALGGLFCDARLKRDVTPYGFGEGGQPLFAFRYGWEDETDPVRVGPLAQIEEERLPGSVIEILGFKYVTRH